MTAWQNGDEATLINLLRERWRRPSCKPGWNRPCWRAQPQLGQEVAQPAERLSFIVVGALHLYGEHGLLALLETTGLAHHAPHRTDPGESKIASSPAT